MLPHIPGHHGTCFRGGLEGCALGLHREASVRRAPAVDVEREPGTFRAILLTADDGADRRLFSRFDPCRYAHGTGQYQTAVAAAVHEVVSTVEIQRARGAVGQDELAEPSQPFEGQRVGCGIGAVGDGQQCPGTVARSVTPPELDAARVEPVVVGKLFLASEGEIDREGAAIVRLDYPVLAAHDWAAGRSIGCALQLRDHKVGAVRLVGEFQADIGACENRHHVLVSVVDLFGVARACGERDGRIDPGRHRDVSTTEGVIVVATTVEKPRSRPEIATQVGAQIGLRTRQCQVHVLADLLGGAHNSPDPDLIHFSLKIGSLGSRSPTGLGPDLDAVVNVVGDDTGTVVTSAQNAIDIQPLAAGVEAEDKMVPSRCQARNVNLGGAVYAIDTNRCSQVASRAQGQVIAAGLRAANEGIGGGRGGPRFAIRPQFDGHGCGGLQQRAGRRAHIVVDAVELQRLDRTDGESPRRKPQTGEGHKTGQKHSMHGGVPRYSKSVVHTVCVVLRVRAIITSHFAVVHFWLLTRRKRASSAEQNPERGNEVRGQKGRSPTGRGSARPSASLLVGCRPTGLRPSRALRMTIRRSRPAMRDEVVSVPTLGFMLCYSAPSLASTAT